MRGADFDLRALCEAIDTQRSARELSWAEAVREMSGRPPTGRSIAVSTITGLKGRSVAEGDGVLQMLLWLDRTPESFVPGYADADAERFHLPRPERGRVLRWDARALYRALNVKRLECQLTWAKLAREIGAFSPSMLTHLAKGGRVGFPGAMRLVRWLGLPAADFTRSANR